MSGPRECGVCWSVYDPAVGDDVWQIPPGTAFDDLPADWRCPKCDSAKEKFVRPEAEVSALAPARGGLGAPDGESPVGAVRGAAVVQVGDAGGPSARGSPGVEVRGAHVEESSIVAGSPVTALEVAYRAAGARMAGLPVVNPALGIELFGFRSHLGGWAGIVVTPWCMNVIFVPPVEQASVKQGSKRPRVFPSGTLEFTVGSLEGVGVVESCSLFSPMGDFLDMATARRVAQEAVDALFTREPVVSPTPPAPLPAPSRRDLFRRAFALR